MTIADLAASPLAARSHPDFSQAPGFTDSDRRLFTLRGLDDAEQAAVETLYGQARASVGGGTARSFLLSLDAQSLDLLQHASSLAQPIDPAALTEEGAANLLLPPHEAVDLDNNGIVEVGAAKIIAFPPVNAPQPVKDAWNATLAGMEEGDALTLAGLIGLPLAMSPANPLGHMASPSFDWRKLMQDLLYTNDLGRPYNKPEMSDKVDAWYRRFLAELETRGLA